MRHIDQNIQDRKLTSASLFQIQAMEPATSEHGNGAPHAKSLRAAGTKQHKSGTTRQPPHRISRPLGPELLTCIETDNNKTQTNSGDHI
ncbi:hypothetical protein PGT21_029857 [Puccinia graminis f. sp. tritici]|uniref:Uncharacterized protein n=1 Tax=Puccinia graminis f. sp. tritici TaxID=56615 RepID=A0A5B0QYK6_PUCGR|nr:hypothetical protein PGT21_029857 [Puccinia graminis f. sp. tritici]